MFKRKSFLSNIPYYYVSLRDWEKAERSKHLNLGHIIALWGSLLLLYSIYKNYFAFCSFFQTHHRPNKIKARE